MARTEIDTVTAARLQAQLLTEPADAPAERVVTRLLAVQAQDLRGARLAIRSRSTSLTAALVDRALTETRSLVVTWLNRGTLHLVTADDYRWLQTLTTPQLAVANERRLRQEGVSARDADRGVELVVEAVTADGPQTREQLRARLDAAGVPTAGQALVHVLFLASCRGFVVRGPMVENDQAFVAVDAWLGSPRVVIERDEALAALARRYLCGHAPASARDLAKWAGITLGDARRGFAAIASETASCGGELVALVEQLDTRRTALPAPRLLGSFDPLLHGWVSRDAFVGAHRGVVTVNGVFRPVALVDGRVVATWTLPGGVVTIAPLEPIAARARTALVRDAADVLRYLGLPDRPAVFVNGP